jgi:carbohydrate-selective porin OprB
VFGAALLCALIASGPVPARAQSVQSLQEHIQNLEKQLNALKDQLKAIQEEQKAQKAKVEKQEKALAPLADVKKTVEALSKIEISGGATGTVQGTSGAPRALGGDEAFGGGSFDFVLTYKPLENVKLILDMEAIGGDGPDGRFPTLAGLNGDLGTTNDTVTILEAYLEATFLKERLTVTAGKIDITNYIDSNAYANDETGQFLTGAFVNSAVLSAPDNGPGARVRYDILPLPEGKRDYKFGLYVEAGAMNGDRDEDGLTTNKLFEDVYGAVEVGVTAEILGRPGNYRFWAFADGAGRKAGADEGSRRYTAHGAGVSFDQELAGWLGAFFRFGYRDSANLSYDTQAAWMGGFQLMKIIPGRPDDALGLAYGEIKPAKRTSSRNETVYEAYYRWHFTDTFHLSPIIQVVDDRSGNSGEDLLWVFGARLHLDF